MQWQFPASRHEPIQPAERDPAVATELLPLVYEQLLRTARRQMSWERADHTLQPTALVHEAYVRVAGAGGGREWDSRWHFFAAAAEAMRRILVERARRRQSEKHGGGYRRVCLQGLTRPDGAEPAADSCDLLALDEAMSKFALMYPERAELVQLRFFGGLTSAQAAEVMGLSCATAERYWAFAKAWLFREITH